MHTVKWRESSMSAMRRMPVRSRRGAIHHVLIRNMYLNAGKNDTSDHLIEAIIYKQQENIGKHLTM